MGIVERADAAISYVNVTGNMDVPVCGIEPMELKRDGEK